MFQFDNAFWAHCQCEHCYDSCKCKFLVFGNSIVVAFFPKILSHPTTVTEHCKNVINTFTTLSIRVRLSYLTQLLNILLMIFSEVIHACFPVVLICFTLMFNICHGVLISYLTIVYTHRQSDSNRIIALFFKRSLINYPLTKLPRPFFNCITSNILLITFCEYFVF